MEESPTPAIAVVGMSGRFPGAADLAAFWRNLREGVESITFPDAEELAYAGVEPGLLQDPSYVRAGGFLAGYDRFDAPFFGLSPREAELLDPQHRLLLECAWSALEDAACDPARFDGRIGVYAGTGSPAYLVENVYPNRELVAAVGAYQTLLATDKDFLATRISYKLGLTGPSLTVQTACSTSLVAVCLACQSLSDGECDAALAGGVTLRLPPGTGYRYQEEGILSPDGHCRAFDAQAAGTVPGSGVGLVVLKRLEDALADGDPVRAVIRGWAVNNDGAGKVGFTAPRAEGQAEVILEALALAVAHPETVSYVEAHGTGTRLGDPIELRGLNQAFAAARRRGFCGLGSVKTNIGHLDSAAGVASLIKTVLALEHRELPPSLHFHQPNPELELAGGPFYVVDALRPWEAGSGPRRAGVSSFGIGGTNAHLVLEEAPPAPVRSTPASGALPGWNLLLLSARTESALEATRLGLAGHLGSRPGLPTADVAYTLEQGRRPLEHRRAVVVEAGEAAAEVLQAPPPERTVAGRAGEGHTPVAFLLPGQGAQHPEMAAGLFHAGEVFRGELTRCAQLLLPHLDCDLLEVLFPTSGIDREEAAARLRHTRLAQPAVFAVSWALARQWQAWGVEPEALLGHSVGEYTAAALAGVFTLEEALALVATRGRLVGELPGGAMLSVPLPRAEVEDLLGEELSLAAVNGADLTTVSGSAEAVAALEEELAGRGVQARRLHTSHAFHSPTVEPAMEPLARAVAGLRPRPPAIPFLSNVTGTWITAEEATDPEYWARQLRQPVLFAPALAELLTDPDRVLLEVGPGEVLSTLVRRQPAARERTVVPSLPHPDDLTPDAVTLLKAAGRLWAAGVELDGRALAGEAARRLPLPTYPFEGERYWVEPPAGPGGEAATASTALLTKRPDLTDWFYLPSWRRALPALHRRRSGEAEADETTAEERRPWLVLLDEAGLGAKLVERLRGQGRPVVTVRAGEQFEQRDGEGFTLRPDEAADYDRLLAALLEAGPAPRCILHLWGVLGTGSPPPPSRLAHQPVFAGLLLLAQAAGRRLHAELVRLTLVTDRLFEVTGGEVFAPARAAAVGLARVISQEYPNLLCRALDLGWTGPGDPDEAAQLDLLAAEAAGDATAPVAALRGRHLWRQSYEPLPLAEPGEGELPLAPGDHVLITGGLGRFGRMLARHLGEQRRARLSFIDLPGVLGGSEGGEADGSGEAGEPAATLAALAEAGVEHRVLTADVTDREALTAAVAGAVESFGPPAGVIHAAGAPATSYATLAELDLAACEEHLAPKGRGVALLEEALAAALGGEEGEREDGDRRPAWGLLASSLSAVLGGIGLAAFAAADALLDAHAEASPSRFWRSVNWEGWQSFEIAGAGDALGQQQNELVLTPDEVAAACERTLTLTAEPRLVVAAGDLEARLRQWTHILAGGVALRRPGGGLSAHERRSDLPYRAPESEVERRVAAVWQQVLGVEELGLDDDFFLFGGSSLSGLQILTRLRGEYDVELPLKSFFESRTVAGMARLIEEERARRDQEEERMAAILAEIEAMSADEVTAEISRAAEDGEASS